MSTLKFKTITDYEMNKYLDYRNLDINLQNSVSNKKIKKIDHYVWWLRNIDRKSYIVKRENTDLIVLYHTINILKKKNLFFLDILFVAINFLFQNYLHQLSGKMLL